jgi:hypothetical protein
MNNKITHETLELLFISKEVLFCVPIAKSAVFNPNALWRIENISSR